MSEELKVVYVPIDDIKPYERNPRMNDAAVDDVAQSIADFGFRQPIVCDMNGVIIAGHTRYKAAKKLGLSKVPVHYADMSEKEAAAYRLADNKTSQKSIWDNKLLLGELEFIGDEFFTGFELGEMFDQLDESDKGILDENIEGIEYEIMFRSQDKSKIDRIISMWEAIEDEQSASSGDKRQEAGECVCETD